MKKRIKIGNWVIVIASLIAISLSSCGQKAYTQRSSGINGKSGSHVVSKTQSYYNYDAAMNRSKKK